MSTPFLDKLPKDLVDHVTAMCGKAGRAWFDALPAVLRELEREWNISVGEPFPGIEFNFVAEAVGDDGRPVVVKIAPPFETVEIYAEAKFLRLRDGDGAVRLLAEDRERKAILLERALPGEALHERFTEDPGACIDPAIRLLERVLTPPPADISDVPTLHAWFDKFRTGFGGTDFPSRPAERSLAIYERLSSQAGRTFYIHGDYHPGNIVTATRDDFQIIDPKGIVGGVGYDIAVFLINVERWQRDNPDVDKLLAEAISRFAKAFGFSEMEIREWVFAHMVIGAWWNFQDMPELYDAELAMPAVWHL